MKHEKTNEADPLSKWQNLVLTCSHAIAFHIETQQIYIFFLTLRNELKKELGSKQQPPLEFQAFMGFPILLRWLLDKVATLSFCNSIHLHQFALITFQPWRGDSELSEPGGRYVLHYIITCPPRIFRPSYCPGGARLQG